MGRGTRWLATTIGKEVAWSLAAPVTNPIADAAAGVCGVYDFADDAQTAARRTYKGLSGIREINGSRGRARQSRAVRAAQTTVGGEWFHGGGDRTNALAQIGLDFLALQRELTSPEAHLGTGDEIWIVTDVAPVLAEWRKFVERMASSTIAPYIVEWSTFESWWERLHVLRQLARARGIVLTSPEPQPLPKTIWERGADGSGSQVDAAFSTAKTVIFAVTAFAGIAGFYSIFASLHRKVEE